MKLNKFIFNVHLLFGCFVFNQVILAQSDEAADELPPVMILSEAPQSESSSVTLLGGDMVTLGGIQEVRDIQTVLPNFTVFDSNNTRTPKFSVRGLRENNYGAGQAAIGMYVDGIPYTDKEVRAFYNYLDVDKLQAVSFDSFFIFIKVCITFIIFF